MFGVTGRSTAPLPSRSGGGNTVVGLVPRRQQVVINASARCNATLGRVASTGSQPHYSLSSSHHRWHIRGEGGSGKPSCRTLPCGTSSACSNLRCPLPPSTLSLLRQTRRKNPRARALSPRSRCPPLPFRIVVSVYLTQIKAQEGARCSS